MFLLCQYNVEYNYQFVIFEFYMYVISHYRIEDWTVKTAITTVLGDISNIDDVVTHLADEVGVETFDDLCLVTFDDVKAHLKPIQCRKLINAWNVKKGKLIFQSLSIHLMKLFETCFILFVTKK